MQTLEFQRKLQQFNKLYYNISDLKKLLGQKPDVLKVTIHRFVRKGLLIPLRKGLYTTLDHVEELDKIFGEIYFPCYLSFESMLSRCGVLREIPYEISFAWSKKTKTFSVEEITITFHQIKENLFWGYSFEGGLPLAYPEKALLDSLYLVSLGKLYMDTEDLNISRKLLSGKKLERWSKKYPRQTQILAKKLMTRL